MTLVSTIKSLCSEAGDTIASLEKKLGFGNATIRKWDDAIPSGDRLIKVAEYFGVSVDYLLGRDIKKSPTNEVENYSFSPIEEEFIDEYRAYFGVTEISEAQRKALILDIEILKIFHHLNKSGKDAAIASLRGFEACNNYTTEKVAEKIQA